MTPINVLLIEDDADYAELIRSLLEHAGCGRRDCAPYDLRTASSLADGLACLREKAAELLLLDLGLPDSNGIATFRRVHGEFPDVPTVVLTATEDEEIAVFSLREGAQDYLVKTVLTPDWFHRSLSYALERHRVMEACRLSHESLSSKTKLLEGITEAMSRFLVTDDFQEASRLVLRCAMEQTGSETGFVGSVAPGPVLLTLAIEGGTWAREDASDFARAAYRSFLEKGHLEFRNLDNLFGRVILSGKSLLINEPAGYPGAKGVPAGHPPISNFLGVPLLKGDSAVGVICLANRPGGYTQTEQSQIEALARMAGVLYDSYQRLQHGKTLEESLRQAEKMTAVGQLAGGVAHDFNNLLTIIEGHTELLLETLDENDPFALDLQSVLKAAKRASALTKQLLAFSRKQMLMPRVLNIEAVVADMEEMLKRLIGEDIELLTEREADLGRVNADPNQLEQVIMNLALNARDAMPTGGRLVIRLENVVLDEKYVRLHPGARTGKHVMLSMADTGVGMDEATCLRIFEPFFTTKESGKGTGLGLATVYGIVQQSGGSVAVDSEPGRGTTFRVYLPRVERLAEAAAVDPSAGPCPGSETILLVEDEDMLRHFACRVLRTKGYTVLEAANGGEALLTCEQHSRRIHLVITDVVMPRMSGHELVERVKTILPQLRILYMSGYTDDAVIRHGVYGNGSAFLQKPFTPQALLAKVREVLDSPV